MPNYYSQNVKENSILSQKQMDKIAKEVSEKASKMIAKEIVKALKI